MSKETSKSAANVPLCVDLDGTLIRTDVLWESMIQWLRSNPSGVFSLLPWWSRGRAFLKRQIAERCGPLEVGLIPQNNEFVSWLRAERESGRTLVLATASDAALARQVSDQVPAVSPESGVKADEAVPSAASGISDDASPVVRPPLFQEIIASDGKSNQRGATKAATLCERYGERQFDYAGNSSVDLPVWARSRQAIVVNARASVLDRAKSCSTVGAVFSPRGGFWMPMIRALRPVRWIKNLLVLAALFFSLTADRHEATQALMMLVAFCLCASGGYLLNDLCDLNTDRRDPEDRCRPFASGDLPLQAGLFAWPVLMLAGIALGAMISGKGALVVLLFAVLSVFYSLRARSIPNMAILVLAAMLLLRVLAGFTAIGATLSPELKLIAVLLALFWSWTGVHMRKREKRMAQAELQVAGPAPACNSRGDADTKR
jgi:uncharacterized membrane protein YfcA